MEKLYCRRSRAEWEGNEVYNYYLLETKGELRQMSYGNKKIIGASMKGNVTAVKKDTVKVVLMEDKTGGWAGQKWFAYSTIYSSPDGTGWYCMPEKGIVSVYIFRMRMKQRHM